MGNKTKDVIQKGVEFVPKNIINTKSKTTTGILLKIVIYGFKNISTILNIALSIPNKTPRKRLSSKVTTNLNNVLRIKLYVFQTANKEKNSARIVLGEGNTKSFPFILYTVKQSK